MKNKETIENNSLDEFKSKFDNLILENGSGWGVPADKEVTDCVDRVIVPALESVKAVLTGFYETVTVESNESSAVLTIIYGAETYRFSFSFAGKRRMLLVKSSSKYEYLFHKTLTIVEKTNICDDLKFKNLSEINAQRIIEIFDFNFWWHFSERQSYIMNRQEGDKYMNFPY